MIALVRSECLRYKALAEGAIAQLSDDELTVVRGDSSNSIATICRHVSGNLRSRFTDFLDSDGEKAWRHRDEEFVPRSTQRDDMLRHWADGWNVLFAALDSLQEADLSRIVTIRRQPLTVAEALLRALAHVSYHVGQIVFIAKAARGEAWTSLSIPPGESEAYNAAPTRDRAPAEQPTASSARVRFKPEGYTSVAPYLIVDGADRTIQFAREVFGAATLARVPSPSGTVMHAELRLDDTVVMLADSAVGWPSAPAHVHIYVPDVDAAYQRALETGAEPIQSPAKKEDADRRGGVKDAGGTTWWIATRVAP
jgi:uncharacterized glyoxalase superfamily protein PhnB/uncharacterized damage-inducible protein DinB